MEYARQATQPDWFNNTNELHVKATNGSSPFNEYYAFPSRKEAVEFISHFFKSQSFMDNFFMIDGEYYEIIELEYNEEDSDYILPKGIEPASLEDMVQAESRF